MASASGSGSAPLNTFRDDGVLVLANALSEHVVATLKRDFWHEVSQTFGISEEDPDTWFVNPGNPAGDSRGRRLAAMNPIMGRLRSANQLAAAQCSIQNKVDELFGAGRWEPVEKWYSLLSFPGGASTWTVPNTSWHNDEPTVVGDDEPWSLFAFVFLDRVERDTGPTVAITGSHRRGETIAAQQAVQDERQVRAFDHGLSADPAAVRLLPVGQLLPALTTTDPWFAELVDKNDNPGRAHRLLHQGTNQGSTNSRVIDLTGDAGDVILFDPRCLHTFSANISQRPRQILRLDFRRTA